MYQILAKDHDLKLIYLDKSKQKWLSWRLRKVNFSDYDAVISDLHFKNIHKQPYFFKTIRNLFFLEEDACQNYIQSSQWYGIFSRFYKNLPDSTVMTSGYSTAEKLSREGVCSYFITKAYDHTLIKNYNRDRDITLGFIGNIENKVYKKRRETLLFLKKHTDLKILKTDPGIEYVKMLNRIEYFVSADKGLGEYMIKNFEAMAAGCILCAWRQGFGEEEALGLKDLENCILYSDSNELTKKINLVSNNINLKKYILKNSQDHATKNFSYATQERQISATLLNTYYSRNLTPASSF